MMLLVAMAEPMMREFHVKQVLAVYCVLGTYIIHIHTNSCVVASYSLLLLEVVGATSYS